MHTRSISVTFLIIAGATCLAQTPTSTEITAEQVGENLYVFFGNGGNIVASIGEQGVLIVDDQFPEMVPKYRATIRELGGGEIDFAVNTHWHFDMPMATKSSVRTARG